MSARTSIEWTDRTWNPVRGCSRVSEGCTRCYAETFAARNLPEMRSPTTGEPFAVRTPAGPRWTGAVELIPSKLDEPLRWRKPQRIFVNSMSDLFHEALPVASILAVFTVMARARQHTFQVLTKRPERMRHVLSMWAQDGLTLREGHGVALPNVWLGVSVEDQATADERILLLLQTPAAVRFISLEPQLAHVDLSSLDGGGGYRYNALLRGRPFGHAEHDARLDWVIVGGESGPGARPFDVAWARSAVAQCRAAGVPVFVKQLGARPLTTRSLVLEPGQSLEDVVPLHSFLTGHAPLRDRKGGSMDEWPEGLRVREFPA